MYKEIKAIETAMGINFNNASKGFELYDYLFTLEYCGIKLEIPIYPETWSTMEEFLKKLEEAAKEYEE